VPGPSTERRLRVAILLSTESFEHFFQGQLGYDRERYVDSYRNDWAWDYCRALQLSGMDALLYVASHGPSARHDTPDGHVVRFLPIGRAYEPHRRIPALKRSPLGRWIAQIVNARAFLPALRAGLEADGVDVLAIQEYWTGRFDVLARRLDQVPLIGIDQGLPDRREVKWLKRRTLPRPRAIVTQTEREATKVRRYGGHAHRIPNGVDSGFFSPLAEPAERGTDILIAARLVDAQKRLSDLVEALALLPADWRLHIAGEGPDEAELRALVVRRGLQDRVLFHGFLDRTALRDRYRTCGVFALPSAYEGLPMALLEAMACAAPTVGSAIPAIAEVLTDGRDGRLVPVGSPTALAGAIQDAHTRRAELGPAARHTVEKTYSQEVFGRRIAGVVRAATGEGAAGRRL
jgi:glycosyltransferase involved in cell wall biosynthesis